MMRKKGYDPDDKDDKKKPASKKPASKKPAAKSKDVADLPAKMVSAHRA